ncbi:MAG: CDF family Co(II)/Ni(II) efflux transporter DmeF [Candidatus Coatesbacteria bacterium]
MDHHRHDHVFGQDVARAGEHRTRVVVAVTAATMVVEIVAGLVFGSMALLADGLHMGSHAFALGIAAFAYRYARRHAADERFTFGTGKVGSLAAFTSATMLGLFALAMGWESVRRLLAPVGIRFDQAIVVAVLGLLVNAVCLLILRGPDAGHVHGAPSGGALPGHDLRHDHTLWSAYLHVLADALTSVCAIAALMAGKYLGWLWLDPAMGIVGAVLIASWSRGLLRSSALVLLDSRAPGHVVAAVRRAVEGAGDARVTDLHVWSIGPGVWAAEIVLESAAPAESGRYRDRLPRDLGLVHVTIEVRRAA